MYLTHPSSRTGRMQSKPNHRLNPDTPLKTSIIGRRFARRSGDKGSVCPALTPTQSTLWGFVTMRGAVDGVVLAMEPLSPLRRLDRLRDGVDDRCVRRGVCIGCLWVLLSLAFFRCAPNQKKSPIKPLEPPRNQWS